VLKSLPRESLHGAQVIERFLREASNLWRVPTDGSAIQQLTYFTNLQIFSFAFSGDEKRLAVRFSRMRS
jgi:hypothetical protein